MAFGILFYNSGHFIRVLLRSSANYLLGPAAILMFNGALKYQVSYLLHLLMSRLDYTTLRSVCPFTAFLWYIVYMDQIALN